MFDLYQTLTPDERVNVCDIVAEALARKFGTDHVNDYDFDLIAKEVA